MSRLLSASSIFLILLCLIASSQSAIAQNSNAFIYCSATDIDSTSVLISDIHPAGPPPSTVEEVQAHAAQVARYASAFETHIKTAHQSNARGACVVKSTRALADAELAKSKIGFVNASYKVVDVKWTPPAWQSAVNTSIVTASTAADMPPPSVKKAYGYCELTYIDLRGQPDRWQSPGFEFFYVDNALMYRINGLASEFGDHAAAFGGAGNSHCAFDVTREKMEQSRMSTRQAMSKKFMGMVAVMKYRDVQWSPKPWDESTALNGPAEAPQFVYCYAQQNSKTVASEIFQVSMPTTDAKHYAELQRFMAEFGSYATSGSFNPPTKLCAAKHSYADAARARKDFRDLATWGRQTSFSDVAWQPTTNPSARNEVQLASAPSASPAAIASQPEKIVAPAPLTPKPMSALQYGFCFHTHSAPTAQLTEIFERPRGGDMVAIMRQYNNEFERHVNANAKLKRSLPLCLIYDTQIAAEIQRDGVVASLESNKTPPQIIASSWAPSDARVSLAPQGPAVPLHVACTSSNAAKKPKDRTLWHTSFSIEGESAAAQLQALRGMTGKYQSHIATTMKQAGTLFTACVGANDKAAIDQHTSQQLASWNAWSINAVKVDWVPR